MLSYCFCSVAGQQIKYIPRHSIIAGNGIAGDRGEGGDCRQKMALADDGKQRNWDKQTAADDEWDFPQDCRSSNYCGEGGRTWMEGRI